MVETEIESQAYSRPLSHRDVVDRYWLSYPHGHEQTSGMMMLDGPAVVFGPVWTTWDDARVILSTGNVVNRYTHDGGEIIFHRLGEMEAAWWPTPVKGSMSDIYRPKALR